MNLVDKLIKRTNEKSTVIVVIGDVMVDHWVHVKVQPCQDGCEKLVKLHHIEVPGGAGNAKNCLNKWSSVVTRLYGQVGEDRSNKWRFINENDKILFRYDDDRLPKWHLESPWKAISKADAVLISDYDKGLICKEQIRKIIDTCAELGIPCVADAKRDPSVYHGAILKCNMNYAQRFLQTVNDIPEVVVTRCELPPTLRYGYLHGYIQDYNYNLPDVKCINHVGGGDCFAAHLTLALACEFSLEDAVAIAHSAGRVYVQHRHNRPPRPHEISQDFSSAG